VCDNGSKDGTVALAESWADRLPLRVIDASAIPGAGPARNEGVRVAQGEWIGFCDADDEASDNWLARLCAALEVHPFVAGRFEGERLNSARTLRSRAPDQQDDLQRSSPAVGLPHAGAGNLGIHRSVFLAVEGFDPSVRYLQDTDLCWRVQLAGYPLVFVPDLVMHVRLRSTLRSMYRQGRNYGASQALLERRHAGAARRLAVGSPSPLAVAAAGAGTATGPTVGHGADVAGPDAPDQGCDLGVQHGAEHGAESRSWWQAGGKALRGAARLARYFVRSRSSVGAQAWQLGWHLGHRS